MSWLSPETRVSPFGEGEQTQKQRTVLSGKLMDLKMSHRCILSVTVSAEVPGPFSVAWLSRCHPPTLLLTLVAGLATLG